MEDEAHDKRTCVIPGGRGSDRAPVVARLVRTSASSVEPRLALPGLCKGISLFSRPDQPGIRKKPWDTTVSGWTTVGEKSMRLLVVTLCCFVAPPIVRADFTDDAAIKAIKQLHGTIDQNGRVVDLSCTEVTDAELKKLAAFKNLTTLDLSWTRVTNAGMKELAALTNLTNLDLSETSVTSAG